MDVEEDSVEDEMGEEMEEMETEEMEEIGIKPATKRHDAKIQIISDLHIEIMNISGFRNFVQELVAAQKKNKFRNVALLGDIGDPGQRRYAHFIEAMSENYENVFVLAGNHEYWQASSGPGIKSLDQIRKDIQKICDNYNNVHFMDNKAVALVAHRYDLDSPIPDSDEVIPLTEFRKLEKYPRHYAVIIGSTLWSDIPQRLRRSVVSRIQDYKNIRMHNPTRTRLRLFDPDDCNKLHQTAIRFITREVEQCYIMQETCIVLSHHAPSKHHTSSPKYKNQESNCAYSTNVEHLFKWGIHTWAFGHTHWQLDEIRKGVRLFSNPKGYRNELRLQNQEFKYENHIDFPL